MGQNDKKISALIKATDVASVLNLSKTHVYFLVRRGDLPAVFLSEKAVRFDPNDVQEFIDSRRTRGEE